jgi:hypothetical protein
MESLSQAMPARGFEFESMVGMVRVAISSLLFPPGAGL